MRIERIYVVKSHVAVIERISIYHLTRRVFGGHLPFEHEQRVRLSICTVEQLLIAQ